jgi:hypothetical protein
MRRGALREVDGMAAPTRGIGRIRLRLAACLGLLAIAAAVSAQDAVGTVDYTEGTYSVVRNGEILDASHLGIGAAVENYDVVRTGSDGVVEITVSTPRAPDMSIKVSPNTQFSLELATVGSREQTSLGILGGTVALKVAKLGPAHAVSVVSDSAVMGVRGTEFSVTSPPTGDILVTCASGEVACTDDEGKELRAVPGTAVEKRVGEAYGTVAVGGAELESFRAAWEGERVKALRANALALIRKNAALYESLMEEFNGYHAELLKQQRVLTTWYAEEKQGRVGTDGEVREETMALTDVVARLRETLFLLERVHYRLVRLEEHHRQGFGNGTIRVGLTTEAFFARLRRESADLERKMAVVRHVSKLLALRSGGSQPGGELDIQGIRTRRLRRLETGAGEAVGPATGQDRPAGNP